MVVLKSFKTSSNQEEKKVLVPCHQYWETGNLNNALSPKFSINEEAEMHSECCWLSVCNRNTSHILLAFGLLVQKRHCSNRFFSS